MSKRKKYRMYEVQDEQTPFSCRVLATSHGHAMTQARKVAARLMPERILANGRKMPFCLPNRGANERGGFKGYTITCEQTTYLSFDSLIA